MNATMSRYFPAHSHPATGRLEMRARAGRLTAWLSGLVLLAAAFFAGPASAAIDLRVESRPISDPIQAYVTVTDGAGNPVGGLTAGNFTITLDGNPLTIQPSDFSLPPSANPAKNVSIVFVMDYSSSVEGSARDAMEGAVVNFINSMSADDYAAIVKFSATNPARTSVVQPFTRIGAAGGKDSLVNAVMLPFPGDGTNLYEGINVALDHFVSPPVGVTLPPGPRAVVVISDGLDNASINTQSFVLDKASSLGIPLFTIAVGTPGTSGSNVMSALAARSGGNYISAPSPAEVTNAYVTISSRLDNGYLLSFVSSITDCNQHTLSVTVTGQSTTETKFTRCDATTGPVTVPNVVNLTQAAATTAIVGAGLVVGAVTQQSSATVPAGRVSSQNPTSGVGVAAGSAVNLVVSTGPVPTPGPVAVPNVVNQTQAAATGDQRCGPSARHDLTIVQRDRACGPRDQPAPGCRDERGGRFGGRAGRVDGSGGGPERCKYDAGGGDHGDLLCWVGDRYGFTAVECHGAVGQRDQSEPDGRNERGGRFGGSNSGVDRRCGTAPATPALE